MPSTSVFNEYDNLVRLKNLCNFESERMIDLYNFTVAKFMLIFLHHWALLRTE